MRWLVQIALSAVLGIAIAAAIGWGNQTHIASPTRDTVAATTPAAVALAHPTSPLVEAVAATTPRKEAKPVRPAAALPEQAPPPAAQAAANMSVEPPPAPSAAAVNSAVRDAVVNIICTTKASGPFNSISGSGVLIDSRGIILTNAHIAQYFLLKDYPEPGFLNCVIRTGSPAYPRYTAELLYLPPSWMSGNADKINQADPTGDGEHDYALLRIAGTAGPGASLPASFPHLAVSTGIPQESQDVLLSAYAAGFLGGITVAKDLYESSAWSTVGDLYTFATSTLDLFSVGGTVVAQKGSSGGAVTDRDGTLIGLIVTATEAADTASRDLRAISTPYIMRDFEDESGISLPAFLTNDTAQEAARFSADIVPALRAELVSALENQNR